MHPRVMKAPFGINGEVGFTIVYGLKGIAHCPSGKGKGGGGGLRASPGA
jgi:hypothetical protein